MNYPHPIIAREGWPFIAIAVVVALLVHAIGGFGFAWLFWLIVIFIVQFFRDPQRPIPTQANAVLCPADGRIVAVETAHDPYANREALKISVFMNVFNVHSQRSPVDGAISKVEYFPGAYLNAAVDKASTENERNAIVIQTAGGHTVTSVQIAGLIARRILCYVHVRRAAHARSALRLHPLRLARRRVSAGGQPSACVDRREGVGVVHDPRRIRRITSLKQRHKENSMAAFKPRRTRTSGHASACVSP